MKKKILLSLSLLLTAGAFFNLTAMEEYAQHLQEQGVETRLVTITNNSEEIIQFTFEDVIGEIGPNQTIPVTLPTRIPFIAIHSTAGQDDIPTDFNQIIVDPITQYVAMIKAIK